VEHWTLVRFIFLANEKFYSKRARFQIIILGSEEPFIYLLDQEYLSICWVIFCILMLQDFSYINRFSIFAHWYYHSCNNIIIDA